MSAAGRVPGAPRVDAVADGALEAADDVARQVIAHRLDVKGVGGVDSADRRGTAFGALRAREAARRALGDGAKGDRARVGHGRAPRAGGRANPGGG